MNVVGRVSSLISQGVFSVATPFHPFGGAVDIIVVEQDDGTYKSTPWYARFGKFQGVLKGAEKIVRLEVNGVEANFNMFLDNSGEAYFVREVDPGKDGCEGWRNELDTVEEGREDSNDGCSNVDSCSQDNDILNLDDNDFTCDDVEVRDERVTLGMDRLGRVGSDCDRIFYEFNDEKSSLEDSPEFPECGASGSTCDNLDDVKHALESQNSNSEVILVSIDGHILTAPLSSSGRVDDIESSGKELDLGSGEGSEKNNTVEDTSAGNCLHEPEVTTENICRESIGTVSSEHFEPGEVESDDERMYYRLDSLVSDDQEKDGVNDVFRSCLDISKLVEQSPADDLENVDSSAHIPETDADSKENSHLSTPIDKTEEDNLEILTETDKSSPRNSENLFCVSLPKLKVASHQRNTSDMDYDDFGHIPDQPEENQAAKIVQSNGVSDKNSENENVGPANGNRNNKLEKVGNENSEREHARPENGASVIDFNSDVFTRLEISICGHLLYAGMGLNTAREAFDGNRLLIEDFRMAAKTLVKNEDLVVRIKGQYAPWSKAERTILAMQAGNLDAAIDPDDVIPVEQETKPKLENPSPSRGWSLWSSIPFRRLRTQENGLNNSQSVVSPIDNDPGSMSEILAPTPTPTARAFTDSPRKQIIRTNVPTTEEIGSLNLKEGQNMVNFIFSTRVLGSQKVEAHIFLWKWNTRIVISDVDGTITKSDVLGQVMPLVGKDWTHSGIARLFCAIKENGYQLLFLSARAIVQSNVTKTFLFNLKQDGKSLPVGPVVISPDGLFPSLYREVIRRAPHEFKIACLEDIKALFPPDHNPFYAGFGNRDTDELSYRKIGIPKGKIFIINPKGEVAINHRIDVKSYTSLHTLVHDMFPPAPVLEEEDYNSWNYWKMPIPGID